MERRVPHVRTSVRTKKEGGTRPGLVGPPDQSFYGCAWYPSSEKNWGFILLLLCQLTLAAETTPQAALSSALRATPAIGVVVDVKTGRQLAAVRTPEVTRSAPGSLLKPLFLASALSHHEVQPQTTVFCRRDLHVIAEDRDWNLACTHPQTDIAFSAQEALAYSCNRDFAALADRLSPADAAATLGHTVCRRHTLRKPGSRRSCWCWG